MYNRVSLKSSSKLFWISMLFGVADSDYINLLIRWKNYILTYGYQSEARIDIILTVAKASSTTQVSFICDSISFYSSFYFSILSVLLSC